MSKIKKINKWFWIILVSWSLLICASFAWNSWQGWQSMLNQARSEGRMAFLKDISYRSWNAGHGGVYVPVTEINQPNPYLSVPHRDVTTTTGKKLTLINPAYMTRQVFTLAAEKYGIRGHITSLDLLNPGNTPDEWEKRALHSFEKGASNVTEFMVMDGKPFMRFMRPLITDNACLKCHGEQGYKVGDIRGGISVSVPMDNLVADEKQNIWQLGFAHAVFLIAGIGGLLFFNKKVTQYFVIIRERTLDLQRERDMFMQGSVMTFTWKNAENWPVEHVSANVAQILGYSAKEFLDGTILYEPLVHPEDLQRVANEVTTASQNTEASFVHKPYRLISRSGKTVWVQDNTTIIRNKDNEISHYQGYLVDITETMRISEELQASHERLTVTLRSIGDGVITTDIEGKIVSVNKIAEQLTGWSNDDAQGRPSHEVFNIINEETGQKCENPFQRVLEMGRIIGLANHTALIGKDGVKRSIADSGAPIRDRESKIIGVVIVFRDITHEKKVAEELLKIRKLESVGVLAGGIAHDFNNILSGILGNIELAAYRVEKDVKAVTLLSNAQKATQRAAKLTQQLLTFSKGGDPIRKTTSISKLITESADFVLHGSQVSCEYTFQDNLWVVNADGGQVGQVIQNIVINARHAMPEGGRIHIRCDNIEDAASESLLSMHEGNFVRIAIQDTGIGMPQEIMDKIFDPYFTTKRTGSGLGLAICHSIIHKHDGHITVQSSPGKGTTFTLYLPVDPSADIMVAKQQKPGSAMKAARIMVMDDDAIIRELVQMQLSVLGHETVLAADGEQAINKYQELQDSGTPVDIVIMDLTIPGGMGGQEAARQLLQVDPEAKIIVASGYSNDPVMARYREYGFCAAVAKPFDLTELRKGIESALS